MIYYPFDTRIHNFGNVGFGGKIHATFAPYITRSIDRKRYYGRNIREEINDYIEKKYHNSRALDLCCGIGISTSKYGIDTSSEFIKKAKKKYIQQNILRLQMRKIINLVKNMMLLLACFHFMRCQNMHTI